MAPIALALVLSTAAWGETVAAVRLEAADAARLQRYVEIEPGEALTAEAVRKAVERLYATGEFEDVVVWSEASGAGVALVIRPMPAPLLDAIEVHGERVISAAAVRRAARLTNGEPLWPARLDAAAQAAAVALVGEGYLEGRVSAQAVRHGAKTDAVFQITAGPRVRVASAAISGVSEGQALMLRSLLAPKPGAIFRRDEARRAAERMRKRLVENGRWGASVAVREAYDPAGGRMRLVFEVATAAWVRLEFRGDRPPAPLRGRIEALLREGALQPDALEEGGERIEDALREKGHRDARVTHTLEAAPGGSVVVYEVNAGPLALARSVRVLGGEPTLSLLTKTREALPVQDALIDQDVATLTRALEDAGYAYAHVEAELPEGGGELPVLFHVKAGPRTLVETLTLAAPELPGAGAPRELRTRAGRPYRVRDLALDRQALLSAWRNAGHLQADVTPEVSFSEDRSLATVVLMVAPGPRTDVDRIIVKGLERTRESVVRRELTLKEGAPLGLAGLLESQRRLGALGIFERVAITEMEEDAAGSKSLLVEADEAPATTFAYGLGYAEQDRVRGSVEVTRRNVLGMDRTLSAFARASFRANRVLATYREPWLLGKRFELFLTGFREEEDREGFDFIRGGVLLQTAFRLAPTRTLITRYAYKKTHTFNVTVPLSEVDRQFQDATFSGPSATLLEDTRDDPLDPRRGHFLSADVQLSLKAFGGDSFLKSYFQAARYQRLTSRALVALSGRLGVARAFGFADPTGLPLPDRFFAGGDYSLRGFPTDGVDPSGGNGLLLGSVELRLDVSRSVSLAAFSDVGNVYPLVSDMDLGKLRYTAGFGLRYRTAFGPLRADWAVKLDRRPEEPASHLHLTVGHAF
jgi:outer membrane protein assembly factor BamA